MPIELGSFSLGAVAGGAVIAVISHYLTKSRNIEDRKIKEYNEAAAKFRDAFHPEISALAPGHGSRPNPYKILSEAFARHKEAVFSFDRVLPSNRRCALAQAWQEYYSRTDKTGTYTYFEQYNTEGIHREESNKRKDFAYSRLMAIVSIANHKETFS